MKLNWGLFFWLFVIFSILVSFLTPYDSTDDRANGRRSGMRLYIDHRTGCQYLSGGNLLGATGITPRLDKNGKQVCD